MKNLFLWATIAVLAFSCQKDPVTPSGLPKNTALAPEDAYLGNRVKTLMLGLLDLSHQDRFVQLVHREVGLQFDDDDNVLFKKLIKTCQQENMALADKMDQSVAKYQTEIGAIGHDYDGYQSLKGADAITDIMNGFNWNDQHYFLQVYIPFVDEVNLKETPVICFGHQEVETTVGFKLNTQGQVEVFEVDEAYAQEHLVWVVSVNEVVDASGNLPTASKEDGDPSGWKTLGRKAEVSEIFVNDRKESWLKGKGEIQMVAAVLHSYCGYRKVLPTGLMVKISKSEEGQWKAVNPSNSNVIIFANGWPSDVLADSERICFRMYEKDVHGPKSYTPCSGVSAMNYKSQNVDYGQWIHSATSFPNSTTLQNTQITPWSEAGMRILNRVWH